jgi:hypothetical protein
VHPQGEIDPFQTNVVPAQLPPVQVRYDGRTVAEVVPPPPTEAAPGRPAVPAMGDRAYSAPQSASPAPAQPWASWGPPAQPAYAPPPLTAPPQPAPPPAPPAAFGSAPPSPPDPQPAAPAVGRPTQVARLAVKGVPLESVGYYHEISRQGRWLALAFDTRCDYPSVFPSVTDEPYELVVLLPSIRTAYLTVARGIEVTVGEKRVCILEVLNERAVEGQV